VVLFKPRDGGFHGFGVTQAKALDEGRELRRIRERTQVPIRMTSCSHRLKGIVGAVAPTVDVEIAADRPPISSRLSSRVPTGGVALVSFRPAVVKRFQRPSNSRPAAARRS
jgi:hypothetical protein